MATLKDPFKELEPDVVCPPRLKLELVSEIDVIRNSLTVVELYAGDLFNVASAFLALVTAKHNHRIF